MMTHDQLATFLKEHLLRDIMPFWTRHAVDNDGGLNTFIADDGSLHSRDKYLWSQWRAVWVCSRLYRTIDRDPKWLELAWHIYNFCEPAGWLEDEQAFALVLNHKGKVVRGYDSFYTDCFAIYGSSELALASGNDAPLAVARRTADAMIEKLKRRHDAIPHFPYPIPPGARVHGIPMMASYTLAELLETCDEPRYREAARALSDEIFDRFYDPQCDLLIERVAEGGGHYPGPEGSTVVPGHVIEDAWFQIHIAQRLGIAGRVEQSLAWIRRHMEIGWDHQYGGLLHAVDVDGNIADEKGWPVPDAKIWWPMTEAMYALLLADSLGAGDWAMDWYWKVHDVAFKHYPDREHGEWHHKLGRDFSPISWGPMPVKDPFHLPRALILSIECLETS